AGRSRVRHPAVRLGRARPRCPIRLEHPGARRRRCEPGDARPARRIPRGAVRPRRARDPAHAGAVRGAVRRCRRQPPLPAERGRYFSIEGTPFRERALPPGTLRDTYATMGLTSLPPNARIEVSRIAPAFGQPGGGLQIRILDMDSLDGNGWYNAYNQAGLAAPEVGALQNVESHVPQTDAAPAAADAKPANPPRFTPGEASASAGVNRG